MGAIFFNKSEKTKSSKFGFDLNSHLQEGSNLMFRALVFVFLFAIVSCGSEEPTPPRQASVTTISPTLITQTSAASGGSISDDGGAAITARGVVFSTTLNPTVSDNKTTNGSGLGSFTSTINGLTANTQYYVRAYATNSVGTAYGNLVEFTTLSTTATLSTVSATEITINSMMVGGDITSDGGAEVTERGISWSTSPNPTIIGSHVSVGSGIGSFEVEITGLSPNTDYYIRAYATNANGTSYGNQLNVKTANQLPGPPPPPSGQG
tara:strand:- start:58 stop:852 length:795 start_codon:yes stop_codon:yes gene_type:complete